MANKTAMHKLIDYMEENYHLTEESRYQFIKALEEEAEQIKTAFVAGDERGTNNIPFNAEQYFLQEYGIANTDD
jgi:hypothetical protein